MATGVRNACLVKIAVIKHSSQSTLAASGGSINADTIQVHVRILRPTARISDSIRVLSAPGARQLTSIRCGASSTARVSAKRTTAAFDAAYALTRGIGAVAPPPDS